jgi:hypothetical protein
MKTMKAMKKFKLVLLAIISTTAQLLVRRGDDDPNS